MLIIGEKEKLSGTRAPRNGRSRYGFGVPERCKRRKGEEEEEWGGGGGRGRRRKGRKG